VKPYRRSALAIGFLAALAVIAAGATAMNAAGKGMHRPLRAAGSDVQVEATLGSGRVGDQSWTIAGFSEGDEKDPCLEARREQDGEFESLAGCLEPGPLTPTGEPLMVVRSEPQGIDGNEGRVTAVGFLVAPAVATLEATFAVGGSWRPQKLVCRNAAGEVLWDIDEEGCPEASGMRYSVAGISD
jgi:hypothetical protein